MKISAINHTKRVLSFGFFLGICWGGLTGCDLLNKKKCEWYLVPEVKHKHLVEPGWVSLCIKNYNIGRQKCYLKAKLEFAERVFGKPFRYDDLQINSKSFPREVLDVKLCDAPDSPK